MRWSAYLDPPRQSHVALEAVLSRGVDVVGHRALAEPREAHPVVEPVRVLEARVRPQHEPADAFGPAPGQRLLHQCLAQAAAAQVRVEIETMDLGRPVIHALDADRADETAGLVAHDPERAARRRVVGVEAEEIRELRLRLPDEAVFLPDPGEELDDLRRDGGRRGSRARHAAAWRGHGSTITARPRSTIRSRSPQMAYART